ncbi:MAG: divalent-cation tolerance protein CutA [bacterium]
MEKVTEIRIVLVTTDTLQSARHIAKIIVSDGLAACVSIVQNLTSFFSWHSSLHERNEYLLIIKTAESKLSELEERIIQLSNDEVPEILALPADYAHAEYYKWLINSIQK